MVSETATYAAVAFLGSEALGVTNVTSIGGGDRGDGGGGGAGIPPGLGGQLDAIREAVGNASGSAPIVLDGVGDPGGAADRIIERIPVPSTERVVERTIGTQVPDPGAWWDDQRSKVPRPSIPDIPGGDGGSRGGGGNGSTTEVPAFFPGTFDRKAPDFTGYFMDQITKPADVLGERFDETQAEIRDADWSAWTNPTENDPVISRVAGGVDRFRNAETRDYTPAGIGARFYKDRLDDVRDRVKVPSIGGGDGGGSGSGSNPVASIGERGERGGSRGSASGGGGSSSAFKDAKDTISSARDGPTDGGSDLANRVSDEIERRVP